jgi:tetratricopeptide (TPR) repeat protein
MERWRKWRRRRPYVLPMLLLLAAMAVAGENWGARLVHQYRAAQSALREGEQYLQGGHYAEALQSFKYGVATAESVPFNEGLSRRLRTGTERAEQRLLTAELHRLAEQLRPLQGMDGLPAERITADEEQCRSLWEKRTWIAECIGKSGDVKSDDQVRTDLLDVAILYANLQVQSQSPNVHESHEQALTILAQAEEVCGSSCVLFRERAEHARAAGRINDAEAFEHQATDFPARGAWEHYALGRACAQAKDWRQAVVHYDRALAMEPQALWPQFARGLASFQLGEYAEARLSFSICVALAPSDAICDYNRGRTLAELGRFDRAAEDFDRAAQLGSSLAPLAALSRADVYRRQRRFDQALKELSQARRGVAPSVIAYHAALVHLDRHDTAAAEASLRESLRLDPAYEEARQLLERLRLTP